MKAVNEGKNLMKSVVFSGSMRLHEEMQAWADYLKGHGVNVTIPVLGTELDEWNRLDDPDKRAKKMAYIHEHNDFIDHGDVLFVFNPDGRIGVSVTNLSST